MGKFKDERIFQAWRGAIRNTLLGSGAMNAELVEQWCDAWEAEAARRGLAKNAGYWDAGKLWIDAQCAARKTPPS